MKFYPPQEYSMKDASNFSEDIMIQTITNKKLLTVAFNTTVTFVIILCR
jgi:hypothetical protein